MDNRGRSKKHARKWRWSAPVLLAVLLPWLQTPQPASAITLSTQDCRGCHGSNVSTRHHLLLGLTNYLCYDCHILSWDPNLSAFVFNNSRECKTCHTTTLADRHHILLQHSDFECFSCHAVEFDAAIQSFYLSLNFATAREQVSHYFNHMMTPNDCSGCHLNNLVDEHDKRCEFCHGTTNVTVKTAVTVGYRECTACHSTTFKHLTRCAICHAPLLPVTSDIPSLHRRHMHRVNCGYCHMVKDTYNLTTAGTHCAVCHTLARPYAITEVPGLHKIHVKGRGYFSYSCYMCHGKNAPQMHPNQCCVCHDDGRLYNPAQLQTIHRTHNQWFDCTNCHYDPMDYMMYTKFESCVRCHDFRAYPSSASLHGLSHKDKPCWACHPADELLSKRTSYPTGCLACHQTVPSYPNAQWVHLRHVNYQCWSCHEAIYPICPTMKQPFNAASGSVEGIVKDSQGNPLKAVRVYTQNGEFLSRTTTDGGYALRYLPPSYYRIIAEAPGFVTQNQQLKIRDGQTATVNFTLAPVAPNMASVTGRVTDSTQGAVSGATVKAVGGAYSTVSAPDGVYTLPALPPGTYSIEIAKIGFVNDSKSVTTTSGQSSTLNFSIASVPQNVLCNSCHSTELGSKVSCSNKKWRKHFKEGRVTKKSYEDAEIKYLGQTCTAGGFLMGAATFIEPAPPPSSGDLSLCVKCHSNNSAKVLCGNMKWRVHFRKKRVDQATFNLAEITYMGNTCY